MAEGPPELCNELGALVQDQLCVRSVRRREEEEFVDLRTEWWKKKALTDSDSQRTNVCLSHLSIGSDELFQLFPLLTQTAQHQDQLLIYSENIKHA